MEGASYSFSNGHLRVCASCGCIEMTGWPTPEATLHPLRGRPEPCRPTFPFVVRPDAIGAEPALAAFSRELPPAVIEAVEPFAAHQWNLFVMLSRSQAALDLAKHNPVLAYFVANNDEFCRERYTWPPADVAAYRLGWKQVDLLKWLGFPARPSVAKLLRKIEPRGMTLSMGRILRETLANDALAEALSHLPRVNADAIWLLANGTTRGFVTPQYLHEIIRHADPKGVAANGSQLVNTIHLADVMGCRRAIGRLRSMRAIDQLSSRVAAARAAFLGKGRKAFIEARKPPPDTPDIVRLREAWEVIEESRRQHNCVNTLAAGVQQGQVFLYRVLRPQRATLRIERNEGYGWHIAEIKANCNREVEYETRRAVQSWLDAAEASLDTGLISAYRRTTREFGSAV